MNEPNGDKPPLTLRRAVTRMAERLSFPEADRILRDLGGFAAVVLIAHPDGRMAWATFEGDPMALELDPQEFVRRYTLPASVAVLEPLQPKAVVLHG